MANDPKIAAIINVLGNHFHKVLTKSINSLETVTSGEKATIHISVLASACALMFVEASAANYVSQEEMDEILKEFMDNVVIMMKTNVKPKKKMN